MPALDSEPRRILIAERDRHVRELQQFFLERAGFCVEFADDGLAALAQTQRTVPAAVVTEILLPKLDGLALCRRLHDDPATRDIPVVVFSILAAAVRASDAGAFAFLRKPLVETVFLATIHDAIAVRPTSSVEQQ